MAGHFNAVCKCGYRTKSLWYDAWNRPGYCRTCNSILTVTRQRFKFTYENCHRCDQGIRSLDLIPSDLMKSGEWSGLTCPKCDGQLYMHEGIRTVVVPVWDEFIFPLVGQEVHGKFEDKQKNEDAHFETAEIYVPDLPLLGTQINLDFTNTEPNGRRFSMKVKQRVRLDEHLQVRKRECAKLIREITLDFVSYL